MGLEPSVEPSQLGNPTCQEEANDRTATIKIDLVFAVAVVVLTAIAVGMLAGLRPRWGMPVDELLTSHCITNGAEDWPSRCEACVEMRKLTTVNRQWMNLTKEFDGITETRSRRCKKRQRKMCNVRCPLRKRENEGQGGQQA